MKLAYIVDSELPSKKANAVHAIRMSTSFVNNGADVTLFCKIQENTDVADAVSHYGVEQRFKIKAFNPGNEKGLSHKLNIVTDGLKQARNVKAEGPFDYMYARARIALFFLRNYRPYMMEAHEWPSNRLLQYIEKRILSHRNCKGLVVITKSLKEKYLQEYTFLNPEKVYVLHDGANKAVFHAVKQVIDNSASVPPDCTIGYLGHLYPGKCMEIIIQLASLRPKYAFHIAGGTDQWVDHWKQVIRQRKLNNIILYGYIDNKDVHKWYNAFDVFLLPILTSVQADGGSKRDIGKWTSPIKLFEAMSYGKAILVSRVSTLQEVIEEERDGLMASPNDIEEWARQLDRLVNDPQLRSQLGKAAKEKLEAEYTWDHRASMVMQYLLR